mgnify:CR=1 FL=1
MLSDDPDLGLVRARDRRPAAGRLRGDGPARRRQAAVQSGVPHPACAGHRHRPGACDPRRGAGARQHGKEHGEFIYFGNGNYNIVHKLELNNYKDGVLDGETIYYHINGEKNSVINYKDGKEDGKNIFYDKDGKIYWSGTYKDGVLIDGGSIESDKPFNLY